MVGRGAPAWLSSVTPEERGQLGSLTTARLQCLFILQLGAKHGADELTAAEVAGALQRLGIAMNGVGARNALDAAAQTTPRLAGSPPTATGFPRSFGSSRCSTDA